MPKGSLYYYFESTDAFGEAMLQEYFTEYLADMDEIFARTELDAGTRLMQYWDSWRATQSLDDPWTTLWPSPNTSFTAKSVLVPHRQPEVHTIFVDRSTKESQ